MERESEWQAAISKYVFMHSNQAAIWHFSKQLEVELKVDSSDLKNEAPVMLYAEVNGCDLASHCCQLLHMYSLEIYSKSVLVNHTNISTNEISQFTVCYLIPPF